MVYFIDKNHNNRVIQYSFKDEKREKNRLQNLSIQNKLEQTNNFSKCVHSHLIPITLVADEIKKKAQCV